MCGGKPTFLMIVGGGETENPTEGRGQVIILVPGSDSLFS